MRVDSFGMFWEEMPAAKGAAARVYIRPPVPDTGWRPPTSFPNLDNATCVAIDCETYDPELGDAGPGWARGIGHIVGFSIAAMTAGGHVRGWYFPLRHEDMPEHNLDPDMCLTWLSHVLSHKDRPVIGANITYDIGWLKHEGVEVAGPLYDVQFAEALLDESAPVALEEISQKYLGTGKESNLMYDWISKYFTGTPKTKLRKWIYKTPPCLVGPYAESDAVLPLQLMRPMWSLMEEQGLLRVFIMECELIPLMVKMRFRGVNIDIDKAERVNVEIKEEYQRLLKEISRTSGVGISSVYSSGDLQKVFDALGVKYPTTEAGNPSFQKEYLNNLDHPIGELIRSAREHQKMSSTFIESYLLDKNVNGVVYGSFHQLRGTGGGTRSGRFSSSDPNLQNIPSRTNLGKRLRELFIPDHGHMGWRKYDYSQIEYRMLLHFAVGPQSDEVRQYFNKHPETDYHDLVIALIYKMSQVKLDRKPAKNINFGLIYGMGKAKLIRSLGLTKKKGDEIFEAYHKGVPFAKSTMDDCSLYAGRTGYIDTILGRKSRFETWEPQRGEGLPLPLEDAIMRYGTNIKRSMLHKALNRRLQGSAADMMKMAMLQAYKAGIYDVIGVPTLTVHDETDHSDPGGFIVDDAFREMKHIYENAIEGIRVPIKADYEFGPNWGQVSEQAAELRSTRIYLPTQRRII